MDIVRAQVANGCLLVTPGEVLDVTLVADASVVEGVTVSIAIVERALGVVVAETTRWSGDTARS